MKKFIILIFVLLLLFSGIQTDVGGTTQIEEEQRIFYSGIFAGCVYTLVNIPQTTKEDMPKIMSICTEFTDSAIELDIYNIHYNPGDTVPIENYFEEQST